MVKSHRAWKTLLRAGAALHRPVRTVGVDVERTRRSFHNFAGDPNHFDTVQTGKVEHGLGQDAFEDRSQSPCARLAFDRLAGDRTKRLVGEGQFDILHLEQALILLHQRVLRIGEDLLQRSLVEIFQRRDDRQTADEFGDQAVLQQILRLDMAEDFAGAAVFRRQDLRGKADRGRTATRGDDLLKPGERTAADEQDVGGVDLQELLLRMLAAALRGNPSPRAFHDLEQRLLHALARDVAGDRGIVGLAADLVDFVDVDDATLGALDVVVGRLQQLENDVLDILTDITGFGQRGGVRHGEGYVEDARQRLRQQRLARTGRSDQQDVRLRKLDIVVLGLTIEPLVVVMDGDREHLLGMALADHVVVQDLADFLRRRNPVARLHQRGFVFLANDVHAELNAFVADEDGRARDQLPDFVLALAAERAIQRVLGVAGANLTHSCLRPQFDPARPPYSRQLPAPTSGKSKEVVNRAKFVPKKTQFLDCPRESRSLDSHASIPCAT